MNTTIATPRLWQRWKATPQLDLLAAFEDSVTCTRVKGFCQGLSRDLGGRCRITQRIWVFSTLRMRELQQIAAEEASVADLVIISAQQSESLPEEVKSWMELWLQQKGARKAVLMALLDRRDDGTSNPIRAYLKDVARRGNMDFMVEFSGPA